MFGGGRCHRLPLRARPGPRFALGGVDRDVVEGGRAHQYRAAQRADLERSVPSAPCDHLQAGAGSAGDDSGHVVHRPYDCDRGRLLVGVDHPWGPGLVPARISGEEDGPGRTWI